MVLTRLFLFMSVVVIISSVILPSTIRSTMFWKWVSTTATGSHSSASHTDPNNEACRVKDASIQLCA